MPQHTKCPTGTRKNKKTGNCVKKSLKTSNGTRKNKMTGGSPKASPKSPDDVCSICLDVLDDDKYKTKCNHVFHSKCLGMACKASSSKKCPYCRAPIIEDCKGLQDIDSIGIMPYLSAMFFYTSSYGRADVDKARADNDAVIKRYLDNPKFDPNVTDDQGRTPLHVAVERRRASVVNNLLARKDIKVDIRDNNGKLAIEYALDLGNNDALAGFRKHRKKLPKGVRNLI